MNTTTRASRLRHVGLAALAGAALFAATVSAASANAVPVAPAASGLTSATGTTVSAAQAVAAVGSGQTVGTKPYQPKSNTRTDLNRTIIGADNRFQVTATTTYPYSATVLIERNGALHCTGWMVSKDTLLTAGHCVHTGGTSGTWYSGLSFKPGSNGGSAPYGVCYSRGTYAYNGWLNNRDTNYDGAIIKLNCTVGYSTGWFGTWWQSASLDGTFTRVTGYPGDKPKTQWMSYDYVRASNAEKLFYQNDTVGGMSGSPVWQYRGSTAAFCANGPCAMGIHTNGLWGTGLTATNNQGTRFTQAKLASIISIINLP